MAPTASLVPNESSTNLVQTSRASSPSEDNAEEISGSELREEMRGELRRIWYNEREAAFGLLLKRSWSNDSLGYMLSIGSSAVSNDSIYPSQLLGFCNKPTLLYWAHSAQVNNYCPPFIWGSIYKEWFRCYDQVPKLDFEYFFANPVCIESTGPTTILGLLEAHKSIYNRTFLLLDRLRRGDNDKPYMKYMDASQDYYKLLPVCRAIIVVLDELTPPNIYGLRLYLDFEVQRQNVLMVRTGEEIGLSEPISFEGIRELALPLARPDLETDDDIDAIRVPLATAVQFIANLQQREEAAFPESASSTAVDQRLIPLIQYTESYAEVPNIDDWVDGVLELANEKGINNVPRARKAMLAVQAAQRGEHPVEENPYHFHFGWR